MDYFDNDQHWDEFWKVAQTWIGTPFFHGALEKGVGADCTTFIGGVLLEAKIITEVKYDSYGLNWWLDGSDALIKERVEHHLKEKLIPGLHAIDIEINQPLKRGDLLGIWTIRKGFANHSALYIGNDQMLHCMQKKGVEIRTLKNGTFLRRLVNVYRIVEEV